MTAAAAIILLLLGIHVFYHRPSVPRWRITDGNALPGGNGGAKGGTGIQDDLPCQKLPGADDVVVIMRTGATEIQDKLPVHFNTTFRCYRDLLIFSDFAETFMGREVHDVLLPMDQVLKDTNKDFDLYRRLLHDGRENLSPDELSGKASFEGSKSGKGDNAGWRLDKWKFLPMMNETLRLRPDKKWYVFVESDSYPVWSNILQWLENVNPDKAHYFGSEVQIGPDIFAHGGSVFVMSRSAIRKGAEYYANNRQWWDEFTDRHWAGDCVLGKELREAGAPLDWSWPMFQGGHPEKMDFTERKGNEKKLWCTPAVSYHHFNAVEMQNIWNFEQTWIQSRLDRVPTEEKRWAFWADYSDVLEHRDVFREFVWPRIKKAPAGFWNSLSPNLLENTGGSNEQYCRHICEENPLCLQYTLSREGCSISTQQVMLGKAEDGYKSGWMMERIEKWMEGLDNCGGYEGWTNTG